MEILREKVEMNKEYVYVKSIKASNNNIQNINDIERLCNLTIVKHTYLEILYREMRIKPYFDYDCKLTERYDEEMLKEHLYKCKEILDKYFKRIDNTFDIERDCAIASRHGKVEDGYKISYRFYIINGMYSDLESMDKMIKTESEMEIFDKSVYNHNRKIAMLFGHKSREDTRTLIPIVKNKWTQPDFIIQYVPETSTKRLFYRKENKIVTAESTTFKKRMDDLEEIEPMEIPKDIDYNFDKTDIKELLRRIPNDKREYIDTNKWIAICYSICETKKMGHTDYTESELRTMFLEFSKRYPNSDSKRDGEVFDSCMGNVKYKVGIKYLYKLLSKIYNGFWTEYQRHKVNDGRFVEYNDTYNEDKMRAYDMEKEILVIKANPGTGKTVELENSLREIDRRKRMCVISYNVVLCNKYLEMFEKLGFKHYKEERDCNLNRLIVCLDSLPRISRLDYDYVILDEVLSVALHMDSSVMKKPHVVLHILDCMLKRNKHVIMLDANADDSMVWGTIRWIEKRKKCKAFWVNNKFVRPTNRFVVRINEKDTKKQVNFIMEKLKKGKRIVVPVSSKVVADILESTVRKFMGHKKIKKYDSDTSRKELYEDSKNPNEAWDGLDLLIYTPTIGAGVSYEGDNFDICVCLFESSMNHALVYTCYQQMFRVRKLNDGDMYLFVDKTKYGWLPTDESDIERMMENDVKKVEEYCNFGMDALVPDDNGYMVYNKESLSYTVIKYLIKKRNESLMFFDEIMEMMLKDNNIPIYNEEVVIKEDKDIVISSNRKATRKLIMREFETGNPDRLVMNMEEMERMERNKNTGEEEISKLDKIRYRITCNLERWGIKTGLRDIDEEFFEKGILSVDNVDQESVNNMIRRAKRYVRWKDRIEEDRKRLMIREVGNKEDGNLLLYKNTKRTGNQKMIICKEMMMNVFGVEDGAMMEIFRKEVRYKNSEWKSKLIKWIEGLKRDKWEWIIDLYGLEKKRYRELDNFKETSSKMEFALVRKIMRDTLGVDFKPICKHYMRFSNDDWEEIKENTKTFMDNEYCIIMEREEDFIE